MPLPISTQEKTIALQIPPSSTFQPSLVALGGATATGKTGVSLALAERLPISIISADSRQVYRELNIGTAKPSAVVQSQVPHYLIDIREPTETMTVAEYQQAAQGLIEQFQDSGEQLPWLVGGTGLYISAVVDGLQIPPVAPQPALRSQLTQLGQAQCYAMLQQIDPAAGQRLHPHDVVRTVRALEVAYVTGQPLSVQQGQRPPDYPILYIGLDCEVDALKTRIEQRTAEMLQQGLVKEVEDLYQRYGPDLPLLKTLGYSEILGYLAGDYSLTQAESLIVKNTRQFAKRQRTWFRKRNIHWFNADDPHLIDQIWQTVGDFLQEL
ncbi:MAG: tRNA (adenosine(37)-N6)-dimethylallyltransferase MiaA [Leptolyngbya sp. SIO1E4]|nr:tRNA (adenosine(37)-N6)-dimethylallyltransferase MiaA [Leptolyngbya sp. SIO1E4]